MIKPLLTKLLAILLLTNLHNYFMQHQNKEQKLDIYFQQFFGHSIHLMGILFYKSEII